MYRVIASNHSPAVLRDGSVMFRVCICSLYSGVETTAGGVLYFGTVGLSLLLDLLQDVRVPGSIRMV